MRFRRLAGRFIVGLLPLMSCGVPAEGFKTIKSRVGVESCRSTVLGRRPGKIVKLEFKTERGIPIYEFEVSGVDGKTWELECDAFEGKIVEEEREVVSADDAAFRAKARVSEQDARGVALKAHPGTVMETEYEIEANGDASYEFDIRQADGSEVKLEVDAASGRIVEDDEQEWYQIGQE